MKKKYTHLFIIFIFLFTSCFTIPGYVDKDGNITPQYIKEIKIEVIKGNVSIIPFETSKGILNKNPTKSDLVKSQKKDNLFLKEGNQYFYTLEGNNSLIISLRTLDEDAIIAITYKNNSSRNPFKRWVRQHIKSKNRCTYNNRRFKRSIRYCRPVGLG